jgi:hypothetical protein
LNGTTAARVKITSENGGATYQPAGRPAEDAEKVSAGFEPLQDRLQKLARAQILRSIIQHSSRGAKVDADEWLDRHGLREGEKAAKLREAKRLPQ